MDDEYEVIVFKGEVLKFKEVVNEVEDEVFVVVGG